MSFVTQLQKSLHHFCNILVLTQVSPIQCVRG